ncbi:MAG: ATP-binding protein [Kofleriaceae bacterium]
MSDLQRILIVDDNEAIHHDFRSILDRRAKAAKAATLDDFERAFGGVPEPTTAAAAAYELAFASQGEDAIQMVAQARAENRPFSAAFVDIRMPPGIDGIATIAQLWQRQPELEVVLCSAYSDYSWEEITRQLNPGDRLVVLRKPFDPIEVRQLAACLCEKWLRGKMLDERLRSLEHQVGIQVEARLLERSRHEEEQRRSRRLEALGTLAAGLAHEINTPTQFASTSLEYLAEIMPSLAAALFEQQACLAAVARGELTIADACARADRLRFTDALEEIPKAIADARTGLSRIGRVVQSVRSHSHLRDRDCLVSVDVNEQVSAALELARNEYKYDADVVVELGGIPHVLGDPGDLCLAVLNLIVNAAHAIRDKRGSGGERGLLEVTTRYVDQVVEITIADSGGGIPVELRDRVFEPFFTTKRIGEGTGQGLPIARATIVERHRGTLRFETEQGKGTVFVIGLPALLEVGAA